MLFHGILAPALSLSAQLRCSRTPEPPRWSRPEPTASVSLSIISPSARSLNRSPTLSLCLWFEFFCYDENTVLELLFDSFWLQWRGFWCKWSLILENFDVCCWIEEVLSSLYCWNFVNDLNWFVKGIIRAECHLCHIKCNRNCSCLPSSQQNFKTHLTRESSVAASRPSDSTLRLIKIAYDKNMW